MGSVFCLEVFFKVQLVSLIAEMWSKKESGLRWNQFRKTQSLRNNGTDAILLFEGNINQNTELNPSASFDEFIVLWKFPELSHLFIQP